MKNNWMNWTDHLPLIVWLPLVAIGVIGACVLGLLLPYNMQPKWLREF